MKVLGNRKVLQPFLTVSLGRHGTAKFRVTGSNPYRTISVFEEQIALFQSESIRNLTMLQRSRSQHNGAVAQLVER